MAGSAAEERIRAKVEAALRAEFPDARLIHEVNCSWGGIRLDLAAVRANAITLVEIKSERDVLKRLEPQIRAGLKITGDVRVYAAERHRPALITAHRDHLVDDSGRAIYDWRDTKHGQAGYHRPNPAHIPALSSCRVLIETDSGFEFDEAMPAMWSLRQMMSHIPSLKDLLEMLWADELMTMLAERGLHAPPRTTREAMKRMAVEDLTGRQIRAGVCAALRSRTFARADAALCRQQA